MEKNLLQLLFFMLCFKATHAQQFPNMAFVVFQDNKYYHGKILSETPDLLQVQFVPSNSIYEFNKQGVITKSNGKYKAGGLVKLISVHELIKDIYNEENSNYPFNFLGIRFGDGRLFYALSGGMQNNTLPQVYFPHSGSTYDFIKVDGKWQVSSTRGGAYPVGHVISSLYMVENIGRFFYTDGSMSSPNILTRNPTGADN